MLGERRGRLTARSPRQTGKGTGQKPTAKAKNAEVVALLGQGKTKGTRLCWVPFVIAAALLPQEGSDKRVKVDVRHAS
jgi:hypothetical protein